MAVASDTITDSAALSSGSSGSVSTTSTAVTGSSGVDTQMALDIPESNLNGPTRPNFEQHERLSSVVKWLGPISICVALTVIILVGNQGHSTPAIISIAFISGAAIGIERVIEGFWNALGSRIGVYWPMTSISRQVHELELELNDALKPFHGHLSGTLAMAQTQSGAIPSYLAGAQKDLDSMQRRFDDIRTHAPSNQRMQLLAACAAQSVNFLVTKYNAMLPQLSQGVPLANTAISGMQDFLATFKDNPGRRLLSLYLGALLGLGLAAIFHLDVFSAVDAATDGAASAGQLPATPGLRIALTGLLIGLGSNPTHEVIQVLQEYKKGKKGKNTATPRLAADVPAANS
jgi:hypothetical protein